MVRGGRSRRPIEDADEFDDMPTDGALTPQIDPKVILQMEDLGVRARDRQTAHDRERDRNIDLEALNRSRKCNHSGTTEAENAVKHQSQLASWGNFGGDSTTNLEDIAAGQYHRLAVAEKVQDEVRQLESRGLEVCADNIDRPHGKAIYRGGGSNSSRAAVRSSSNAAQTSARQYLDPALDPGRGHLYKSGPQSGNNSQQSGRGRANVRGGLAGRGGRGGHTTQLGRGHISNIRSTPPLMQSTPTRGSIPISFARGGMPTYNASKSSRQSRDWPPAALKDHIESSAHALENSKDNTPSESPAVSKPVDKQQTTDVTQAPQQVTATLLGANDKLGSDFKSWFGTIQSASEELTQAKVTPNLAQAAAVSTSFGNVPISVPREDLIRHSAVVDRSSERTDDHYTDGRLSPVDSLLADFDEDKREQMEGQSAGEAAIASSARSAHGSGKTQDLIDSEISELERNALERVSSTTSGLSRQSGGQRNSIAETRNIRNGQDAPTSTARPADLGEDTVDSISNQPLPQSTPASSLLRPRSANVPSNHSIMQSKWAGSGVNAGSSTLMTRPANQAVIQPITRPLVQSNVQPASTNDSRAGASLLGDDSNLRRRTAVTSSTSNNLQKSRFATAEDSSQAQITSIRRQPAGPGYQRLLEELKQAGVSIEPTRRPQQPAFIGVDPSSLFSRYREQKQNDSDDDEL